MNAPCNAKKWFKNITRQHTKILISNQISSFKKIKCIWTYWNKVFSPWVHLRHDLSPIFLRTNFEIISCDCSPLRPVGLTGRAYHIENLAKLVHFVLTRKKWFSQKQLCKDATTRPREKRKVRNIANCWWKYKVNDIDTSTIGDVSFAKEAHLYRNDGPTFADLIMDNITIPKTGFQFLTAFEMWALIKRPSEMYNELVK